MTQNDWQELSASNSKLNVAEIPSKNAFFEEVSATIRGTTSVKPLLGLP